MGAMASQITSLTIVFSNVYSEANHRKSSKLRVTGLCEFPAQMASNPENAPFDEAIMYIFVMEKQP